MFEFFNLLNFFITIYIFDDINCHLDDENERRTEDENYCP